MKAMKRLMLSFVSTMVILLASSTASADNFFVGFSAGAGGAATWTDDDTSDLALGIATGPMVMFQIPFFAVQGQALYTLKGAADNDSDIATRLHYFSVPVTAKLSLELGPVMLEPYLGAEASFLMKASLESDAESVDITDDIEVFDFSLLLGTDLFIEVADDWYLTLDVRTDLGLVNIAKEDTEKIRTFAFYALIGFAYSIF